MNIYDLAISRIAEFGGEPTQLEISPLTGRESPLVYITVAMLDTWGTIPTQTWLMSVYLTYLDDYAYEAEHDMYMALIPEEDNGWLL
jgi:hypothetical protein